MRSHEFILTWKFLNSEFLLYCAPDNMDDCSKCVYTPATDFQTASTAYENDSPRCVYNCGRSSRCKRFAKYPIYEPLYQDEFARERGGKMVCLQHQEALTRDLIREEMVESGKVNGFKYYRKDLLPR